eukprot:2440838-Rhodomonas_salina.1
MPRLIPCYGLLWHVAHAPTARHIVFCYSMSRTLLWTSHTVLRLVAYPATAPQSGRPRARVEEWSGDRARDWGGLLGGEQGGACAAL